MTDFLIRTFVKDYQNTASPAVRGAHGKLAGTVGIVCNLFLCVGKLTVGALFGSIAVMADAFNNLSDAASSIISLLGFKLAGKPADEDHPYGHARYEYLSGLVVAILVLLIGVELFKSSFEKILHPTPVEFSWITVGVLTASILVKLWMAAFNRKVGKKIDSQALIATAADSRNDVISTSAVLLSTLISHYLHFETDSYMGLCVAAFILYSGFGLIRETTDPLLGRAPDAELIAGIRDKVTSYPGVFGIHDLMIHDYGPGNQFASLHVEVAAETDVLKNHDMIDNIECDIQKEFGIHTVIHMDPIITKDEAVGDLRHWLSDKVKEIDPVLSIHDLRVVAGPTHTNLVFDCVVPAGYSVPSAELRRAICEKVSAEHPEYNCVITVENSFAAIPHN
ncbi:MAG: cation transporter [Clostridia bacterium]|nr:cation transporter [Clostridia bacterium]